MRALLITRQGSPVAPNVRHVEDWPEPAPRPGEALVRTEASALNHLDLWVGVGLPGVDLSYPRVSGSDGAGTIERVGAGVDPAWLGRRVVVNAAIPTAPSPRPHTDPSLPDLTMIGEHEHGTLAEKFVAPVSQLVDIGDFDAAEAAAYGLTHLTAWRMLATRARLRPGQWVLITGIGGGVALACLAIARHLGCRTIVTSRHQWKLERAAPLGADHGVLDQGRDWSSEVRQLTGRRGVDVCADSIGKAAHLAAIKSLTRGGVYVSCGCTSGPDATTDLARLFWNQLTIIGSTMGDMDEFRAAMALLLKGGLRPVIDQVLPAASGRSAFERLESEQQFGKIVVRW